MAALLVILTMGLPWLGALSVWLTGDRHARAQHTLAVGFSGAGALAALGLLPLIAGETVLRFSAGTAFGDFTFTTDGLGVFLAAIAAVIGSLTVIFSVDYMRGEEQLGRYYALVLIFIGAMAGLVLTSSLLLLLVFWEIVGVCSYALISFYSDQPAAVRGGIKALVITQIGGIGLLAGALLVHAYTGTYGFQGLLGGSAALPAPALAVVAFGFLVAAAAKSAQVPLHTWLPDAMEAPTPVSALIHAATMVNAGVYLLARFYPAFAPVPGWTEMVVVIGVVSALLAGVMALVATDLKRILAYSTISQLGFMFYAMGAGAIFASQFHLLSHAIFKALLFLGAGAVIHTLGTRDLNKMGGLAKRMPFVATVFVIGGLALSGVPFVNGFWSKELILEEGWLGGSAWAFSLMLAAVFITALYTFRVVWKVFFDRPRAIPAGQRSDEGHAVHDAPAAMRVALGLLAAGTIVSWLLAGPLSGMIASHPESTMDVVTGVATSTTTLITLAVTAVGLGAWWWRSRLHGLSGHLQWLSSLAESGFGFERLNDAVEKGMQITASAARATQTGQLSLNVVGIVGGLVLLIILLGLGGAK